MMNHASKLACDLLSLTNHGRQLCHSYVSISNYGSELIRKQNIMTNAALVLKIIEIEPN